MKFVNRRTFYQTRTKADGSEYTLFSYEIVDDLGNKEVIDSLQEFNKGDRIETWYDLQYDKPKMKLYKSKH
jgi:hypothetical protein